MKKLEWDVDLDAGTIKGDFIHYRVLPGDGCIVFKALWTSPKLPAKISVANRIRRSVVKAYNAAVKEASIGADFDELDWRQG